MYGLSFAGELSSREALCYGLFDPIPIYTALQKKADYSAPVSRVSERLLSPSRSTCDGCREPLWDLYRLHCPDFSGLFSPWGVAKAIYYTALLYLYKYTLLRSLV